jgi:hypothetical protein
MPKTGFVLWTTRGHQKSLTNAVEGEKAVGGLDGLMLALTKDNTIVRMAVV